MSGGAVAHAPHPRTAHDFYLCVGIAERNFGLSLSVVRGVFKPDAVTPVPLAAPEIAGLVNLRGRVHTVIDPRPGLGLAPARLQPRLAVAITVGAEAHALLVDAVGDVVTLLAADIAPDPSGLAIGGATLPAGVHGLASGPMTVLDVEALICCRSGNGPDVPASRDTTTRRMR